MSYCRFIEADVYVFTSSEGIECCGCSLQKREWIVDKTSLLGGYMRPVGELIPETYGSNEEMIAHLEIHRAKGDYVPEHVFDALRDPEDAAENERIWAEAKNRLQGT